MHMQLLLLALLCFNLLSELRAATQAETAPLPPADVATTEEAKKSPTPTAPAVSAAPEAAQGEAYPSPEELEQLMKSLGIAPEMLNDPSLQPGAPAATTPELATLPVAPPLRSSGSEEQAQITPVSEVPVAMPVPEASVIPEPMPVLTEPSSDQSALSLTPRVEQSVPDTSMPMPSVSAEELPSTEDTEQFGIDTASLQDPSGNWLYKRIWYEKAERRYGQIKEAVNNVMDSRMYFFEQRVNLDRVLFDPFYANIGLSRGELKESVGTLIEQLQSVPAKTAAKKQQKAVAIGALQDEKERIEMLQKDIDSIGNIDHAIDDALTKLMNQINTCRQYEQQAWEYLRAIARELSDKVARDHYYAMDAIWKNVKNVQRYIQGEYAMHFAELMQEAQKRTEAVTQTIQQLKEKGIDLKKMAATALQPEPAPEEPEEAEEVEEAPMSWFGWIIHIITWPARAIAGLWHAVFG